MTGGYFQFFTTYNVFKWFCIIILNSVFWQKKLAVFIIIYSKKERLLPTTFLIKKVFTVTYMNYNKDEQNQHTHNNFKQ